MEIFIESPDKLTDSDLEEIADVWNRTGRRSAVYTLNQTYISYIYILSLLMHFVKPLSTSIMNFNI